MSIVISIVAALVVLLVLVLIHEGGHFLMGKKLGFHILEFSIGMGPKLISREKNGTVYSLRAFPIGGMCAFEGEDKEDAEEGCFNAFPAWKRFLVALAGPLMNIITGFIFAAILMLIFGQYQTVNFKNPQIVEFSENAPAQVAGLQEGDLVTKVNGTGVNTSDEMIKAIRADEDGDIDITVLRATENSYYTINGKKVEQEQIEDLSAYTKANPAKTYEAGVEETQEITITVNETYNKEEARNMIGATVSDALGGFEKRYNVLSAFPAGVEFVVDVMDQMFDFLGSIFTGGVSMKDVSGIIGVVDVVDDGVSTVMDEQSLGTSQKIATILELVMYLVVLLSLNLGIINLLPLPALDGGRILFNIIEMVAHKPIPAKVEGTIHAVGLILLLALIAFVTVKDVVMLFV